MLSMWINVALSVLKILKYMLFIPSQILELSLGKDRIRPIVLKGGTQALLHPYYWDSPSKDGVRLEYPQFIF